MQEAILRETAAKLAEPTAGVQKALRELREVLRKEAEGIMDEQSAREAIQEMNTRLLELEVTIRELINLLLCTKKAALLLELGEEEALSLVKALELE